MVVIVNNLKNGSIIGHYGIHLIALYFGVLVAEVLQYLVWDFEYINRNILDVDASIVGMLYL
jgi:hypothetical protein